MATSSQFVVGNTYSFSTHASVVLGNFSRATVIGIVSADVAISFRDIAAVHASIFASLPDGTLNDYKSYEYIIVRNQNNETTVLGLPWIDGATVDNIVSKTLYVAIPNCNDTDMENVRLSLIALGKTPSNLELK